MLAELKSRLQVEEEVRKRAVRRGLTGLAVLVLHVLFLVLLIESEWVPVAEIEKFRHEHLLWLILPPQAAKIPKVIPVHPKKATQSGTVSTYVRPDLIRPQEENNAIDWGLAIGRSLACGANSFEYLTTRQRSDCLHQPWHFVYDRYGNIVLDTADIPYKREERLRPSDIQAHERNTAPVCPKNVDPNAPCIPDIIGGH